MAIDSISAITSIKSEVVDVERNQQLNFLDFIKNEVSSAENKLTVAEESVESFAVGETDNLHQVMLSVSKAQTAFDLVIEVRNRLLEGYKEISRMQI